MTPTLAVSLATLGISMLGVGVTILVLVINAAFRSARMESKVDQVLDIVHDHENRLRDKEGVPRIEEPRHSKPLHQHQTAI